MAECFLGSGVGKINIDIPTLQVFDGVTSTGTMQTTTLFSGFNIPPNKKIKVLLQNSFSVNSNKNGWEFEKAGEYEETYTYSGTNIYGEPYTRTETHLFTLTISNNQATFRVKSKDGLNYILVVFAYN